MNRKTLVVTLSLVVLVVMAIVVAVRMNDSEIEPSLVSTSNDESKSKTIPTNVGDSQAIEPKPVPVEASPNEEPGKVVEEISPVEVTPLPEEAVEDKVAKEKVEKPVLPEEEPITPERRSADLMVLAAAQLVDAATFCALPFLSDGRKMTESMDELQQFYDKLSDKAVSLNATFKLTSMIVLTPSEARESKDSRILLALGNARFAKLLPHAEAAGGKFGVVQITRKIGEKEKVEDIVVAFDKDGKLIGTAD